MNKNKNSGCITGILGTLLVIVGVVAYSVVSSLLNRIIIGNAIAGQSACALIPLSVTGIGVAFFLYEVIFILNQYKISRPQSHKTDDAKLNKILRIVAVTCISASLLFAIVSANTYTVLRNDSFGKVCFVETETYSFDKVSRFTLSCTAEGDLEYTVQLKNGEEIEIFGVVNTCSAEFFDEHKDLYGYAAYLTQKFRESNYIIEENIVGVEYMESNYKTNYPDIWKNLEIIIGSEQQQ